MRLKINRICLGILSVPVLGLMSCTESEKSANSNAWQLKPPTFETTVDGKNEPLSLERFDNAAKRTDPIRLKPSDRLVFSDIHGENGTTLLVKTVCTPFVPNKIPPLALGLDVTEKPVEHFEKVLRLPLTARFKMSEFLPIEALYQPSGVLSSALPCRFRVIAQNKTGSTHDFGDSFQFVLIRDTVPGFKLKSRDRELTIAHSEGYIGISESDRDDVLLPALNSGENFWLKCEDFQIRTGQKTSIDDLLTSRKAKDAVLSERDQLCRLFVESRGAIKNMSDFFMLEIFNVDNLVNNVDLSVLQARYNKNKNSFKIATVTFFNQTKEIYYARLKASPLQVEVNAKHGNRPYRRRTVNLPVGMNAQGPIVAIPPRQAVKVSLKIRLLPACKVGPAISFAVAEQKPLPVLEVLRQDPRLSENPKVEFTIPMLVPSPIPAVFEVQPGGIMRTGVTAGVRIPACI